MRIRDIVRSVFMYGSACIVGAIALLVPTAANAALKYEPSNYAARGNLLLQLDGIRNTGLLKAHDSSSKTWVDLVKDNRVNFGNKTGSGVVSEWADDGYVFGGGELGRLNIDINPGNTFTIQVVFDADKSEQTSDYPHYFGVADDMCNLYTYKVTSNNQLIFRVKAVSSISDASIQQWTGRQNYITALYNKGKSAAFSTETGSVTTGTTETSVGARKFCVGGVWKDNNQTYVNQRYLNGTIKAVRIYNKVLSDDELKQNRALDDARFFNGIPVTNVVVATAVAGLEGNEESGIYAYDEDGYTFTAPKSATLNGEKYVCTGYTLETWDGATWGVAVRHGATKYAAADTAAKVRLTWQWQNVANALKPGLDPLFEDYVTDGLVLHLDGIRNAGVNAAHDDGATTWTDLAGGKTATFYHDEEDASRWTGDGYYFDGRSYAKFADQLTGLTNTVTVQVVCEADTNELAIAKLAQKTWINWPMLVGANDNDTLNVYYDLNNSNDTPTFKNASTSANAALGKGKWEGKYVTAIRNGTTNYILQGVKLSEAGTKATSGGNIGSATIYVGSVGSALSTRNQRWFKGKIKAVRIYDRVLTDEELATNRAIDETRFFGAATPVTNVVVASTVRGLAGDTAEGAYALSTGGHTFSAPASATVGDDTFVCTGYTLETWDDATGAWGEATQYSGTSIALTDTTAKVRLTWLWSHTAGPGYDLAFNDYATDGLVVHLDGIRNTGAEAVHDDAASTWADLASDDYASFTGIDSTCGWTGDGYRFNGRTDSPAYAILSATRTLGSTFTAQAVVDFDANVSHRIETAWPHLFGTTASSGDPFDMYYNQNNNSDPGVNFKVANSHVAGGVTSWGGEYMTGWSDGEDGALFQTATPDEIATFNKTVGTQTFVFAGGNGSGGYKDRRFNGVYKSARIYDRALTNAELAKNRAADEVRFFGRSPAASGDLVVASTVEGLAGALPCGAYRPAAGYTFTSPTEATLDGVPYELASYTLETWNGSAWADGTTVAGGSSVTPDVSSASKRLTWNWAVKSRLVKIQDSFDVGDYVQDGLYLHFDGIRNSGANAEHSDSAATWANLGTGGAGFDATFDYASNTSAGDGWAADGYNFVYGGKFALLGANPAINYFTTIQIVCEAEDSAKPSGQKYPTYFGSTNDYLNIYGYGPVAEAFFKVFNGSKVELKPSKGWQGKYLTAIWNAGANQIFQETVPAAENWSNKWRSNWNKFTDQPFYIGGVYIEGNAEGVNERRLTGKIQAIRVYNRSLSDEELEHNRIVDEARFKGNPPECNVTIATKYGDGKGTGETLAEGVGNYKVEGSYTFSATTVRDFDDALKPVGGYYLETYVDGAWIGKTWREGKNSYMYDESQGKVRITWSARKRGLVLILR